MDDRVANGPAQRGRLMPERLPWPLEVLEWE